jgi:hypothetical protein
MAQSFADSMLCLQSAEQLIGQTRIESLRLLCRKAAIRPVSRSKQPIKEFSVFEGVFSA